MDLIRWNPWNTPSELARWRDDLARAMAEPFRWLERQVGGYPSVEVAERADHVMVRADLPGVDPKDVEVRVTRDAVTLRGETKAEQAEKREGYYHSERRYGSFYRSVPLPVPVHAAGATAVFRHGVLEITAPKAQDEEAQGYRVPIDTEH